MTGSRGAAPSALTVGLLALGLAPAVAAAFAPGAGVLLAAAVAWDSCVLGLFWLDLAAARRAGEVTVVRRRSPRLSLGTVHPIAVEVRSRADRPLAVRVCDPPVAGGAGVAQGLVLQAFERTRLTYDVTPTERGALDLGAVELWVRGPLTLAWTELPGAPAESVAVAPGLRHLRRMRLAARRVDPRLPGLRKVRRAGAGDEFENLREYVPDDDVRRVDWKATARRDRPVTRAYEAERSQNVVVAVDCGRTMLGRCGDVSRMDRAVEGALVLARAALDLDDRVGFLLYAAETVAWLPPAKGQRQFRAILRALDGAQAGLTWADPRLVVRALRGGGRRAGVRRSLVCLFTAIPEPTEAPVLEQAIAVLARRHRPLVVAPADPALAAVATAPPDDAGAVWRRVAAWERLAERRTVAERLARSGARVIDENPGAATLAAVNEYLRVKARGLG